ncbi:MAG: hypothetical protein C0597_03130 [Marinilabiliales bacterium]|nr:MAG: hypothetical protein C0597_03130 [Marinilabiliales bacterium]
MKDVAIAGTSGGYRSVFIQGVLSAFEEKCFFANAYGSCSSSAMVIALATVKKLKNLPLKIWYDGYKLSQQENRSQSDAALFAIDSIYPMVEKEIFDTANRFLVNTSYVKSRDAALVTQSSMSRRLGQKLLIEASKKVSNWRDENLELHLFDTHSCETTQLITDQNLKDVLYATTRMLHAWHLPAYINGKPYLDGSYTSLCPAVELTKLGYSRVICISTEHDFTPLDLFSNKSIPLKMNHSEIIFIKHDHNLSVMGVDYYKATEAGLKNAYLHGIDKGLRFIDCFNQ